MAAKNRQNFYFRAALKMERNTPVLILYDRFLHFFYTTPPPPLPLPFRSFLGCRNSGNAAHDAFLEQHARTMPTRLHSSKKVTLLWVRDLRVCGVEQRLDALSRHSLLLLQPTTRAHTRIPTCNWKLYAPDTIKFVENKTPKKKKNTRSLFLKIPT